MNEDTLWDMTDEEAEEAFKEAKAQLGSPDTALEQEDNIDDVPDEGASDEETIDDLEQPEDDNVQQDSDHNGDEDEAEAKDEENPDAEDETNPDEDDELEEKDSETKEEVEDESQPEQQPLKFKANGKEYEFTKEELMSQFPKVFGQAMDYTKKMQAIKPWRKTIDAIESAKLQHDDINLMIDALKGDKEAVGEILKRTGVDALDLDLENNNYVAKDYGRDDGTLAIKDVLDDISKDVEYTTTHNILAKEWDEKSWNTLAEDPDKIRLLHIDVKDGTYNTIQPIAEKLKVYDGAKQSDLDYYIKAAQQYFGEQKQRQMQAAQTEQLKAERKQIEAERQRLEAVKAKSKDREAVKQNSQKRKDAAPTKSSAGNQTNVINYLEASDEEFEEWRKKLEDSV